MKLQQAINWRRVIVLAPLVVLGLVMVAAIAVVDKGLDPERAYAAENFMMVSAHVVSVIVLARLLWMRCRWQFWHAPSDPTRLGIANHILAGLIVTELGWLMNRSYWLSYRLIKNQSGPGEAEVFSYSFGWLSAMSLMTVSIGMTIAAAPALRLLFGQYWPWASMAFFATTWLIGYEIPNAIKS